MTVSRIGEMLRVPGAKTHKPDAATGESFTCADCGRPLPEVPHEVRDPRRFILVCRDCDQKAKRASMDVALAELRRDMPGTLETIGVPVRLRAACFETCDDLPSSLVAKAQEWAEAPHGMLYLVGGVGAGKSWVSVCILRHAIDTGAALREYGEGAWQVNAAYIGEGDFLQAKREEYDKRGTLPFSEGQPLPHVGLLVFDDLASTRLTDWGRGEVAGLLEARYADDLPTVITSNVALSGIGAAVDPRVASRLAGDGQCWEFPAVDLRIRRPGNPR